MADDNDTDEGKAIDQADEANKADHQAMDKASDKAAKADQKAIDKADQAEERADQKAIDKADKADKANAKAKSKSSSSSDDDDATTSGIAAGIDRAKWTLFSIVSILSLIADQATKIWARADLPTRPANCNVPEDIVARKCMGETVSVIENFWDWRLSMNPGSAFGLFSSQGQAGRIFLSVVGVLAVGGMIWMLAKARRDQKVLHWALAFVAGGAVGNLIDRIYYGVVTDFVLWRYHSKEWPVFNIADVVLVIGVGLMFIDIHKEGKREKAKRISRQERQERARKAGLIKDLK